ncbi:hypothetical protein [Halomonas hibernica]|uniref:hypothetical protein n=1 Tax=Halomonas hibernica TaxID=2591147 RepID=UPI001553C784|nr:hypothetical protein [Halomonas hibernica]
MDDELKAIQDDLDNVLERLGKYLNRGQYGFLYPSPRRRTYEYKPTAPYSPAAWILDGPYTSPREDAARVIFQYACAHQRKKSIHYTNMAQAIFDVSCIRGKREQRTKELTEKHGEDLGHLLAAMDSMANHRLHPLETRHIQLLGFAADAYLRKEVEYFGQNFELQLNSKREVDRKASQRRLAVLTVFNKHRHDPGRYPIGEALFELAGEPFGMSASVVKRAYYAPGMQQELVRLGTKMDELETLHPSGAGNAGLNRGEEVTGE